MRVTQGMLANNSLRHISNSYGQLGKYQEQLNTGKKISRPSDDPVVAMKGMRYRTNLTEIEQYKRNLSEAYQWMDNSEGAMEHGTQVLQRVRELVVQGLNGSNAPGDLKMLAKEIGQLKEDLKSVTETQVAGRYIFNGTVTDKSPFESDGTFNPDVSPFEVEVSKSVKLGVSVNGLEAFGGQASNGDNIFNTLENIENGLNLDQLDDEFLTRLDEHLDNLNAERAELGARYNRLELIEARIGQQEVTANKILSENEDTDIERVITNLKTQESLHRATLAVGARLIQPTLMDFLR